MAVTAIVTKLFANFLFVAYTTLLLLMFQGGGCSKSFLQRNNSLISEFTFKSSGGLIDVDSNNSSCESVYQNYLNLINNFTHCELTNASPFRLCISCTEVYEEAKAFYTNLTEEPEHVDCKIKYMQSDRVQIIPTVQGNMNDIWSKAHCHNCYSNDPNWLRSRKVNYRPDVVIFLELYENFTSCTHTTELDEVFDLWTNEGNTSSKCHICSKCYTLLNEHYNSMYSHDSGDVCMDIMDRMNYSRILWNIHLRCNHHEGDRDAVPVIIISCIVACTPIIFYVSLKVTGKVGRKKIFRQKRLGGSQGTSGDSQEARSAGVISKRRHTTAD